MSVQLPQPVKDVPASARLVYAVLDDAGPLTRDEIQERSGAARRTVSNALATLREEDLVAADEHPDDRRRRVYRTVS